MNLPSHPLQEEELGGDRHHIHRHQILKNLSEFERSIGYEFKHIRLLARAFCYRSAKNVISITGGNNQRLEFLGDSLCSLVVSDYLFRHYPFHHEGHLTLLRCCLVGAQTQAQVSQELGLVNYVITTIGQGHNPAITMANWKHKQLADLFESFIAAVYIDSDSFDFCKAIFQASFYPRLKEFIIQQSWNDPKSCLQQCCLTLREEGQEPSVPRYHVINREGPTHKTEYEVCVIFKGKEIGRSIGKSIQEAEMNAAKNALNDYYFPQREWQKQYVGHKYNQSNTSHNPTFSEKIQAEKENIGEIKSATGFERPASQIGEREVDGRPIENLEAAQNPTQNTYKFMISSKGSISKFDHETYLKNRKLGHHGRFQKNQGNLNATQPANLYDDLESNFGDETGSNLSNSNPASNKTKKPLLETNTNLPVYQKSKNLASHNQSKYWSHVNNKNAGKLIIHEGPITLEDRAKFQHKFGMPNTTAKSFIDRYGNERFFGETEEFYDKSEIDKKLMNSGIRNNDFDDFILSNQYQNQNSVAVSMNPSHNRSQNSKSQFQSRRGNSNNFVRSNNHSSVRQANHNEGGYMTHNNHNDNNTQNTYPYQSSNGFKQENQNDSFMYDDYNSSDSSLSVNSDYE